MKSRGTKKKSLKIGNVEHTESVGMKTNNKKLKRKLVKYEELPAYLKDNEFIRDYYRCEWPLKDTALSLFSLHNETLNIWTYVIQKFLFNFI